MIDIDKNIIMDVEASPSTIHLEVATNKTMIERIESNHGIVPRRLMGDTAYGAAFNLGFLVQEKAIELHIPVRDKTARNDSSLSSTEFSWDEENKQYECPAGKLLKSHRGKSRNDRNGVTSANGIIYRATPSDCKDCKLKDRCCPNTSHRKITRSIHEAARDKARSITASGEYLNKSRRERKKLK